MLAVEWPERADYVLPVERLRVDFIVTGENTRLLRLSGNGERAITILSGIMD